jgi:hypothetical protein
MRAAGRCVVSEAKAAEASARRDSCNEFGGDDDCGDDSNDDDGDDDGERRAAGDAEAAAISKGGCRSADDDCDNVECNAIRRSSGAFV